MNTKVDKNTLLRALSKKYVMRELGINPKYFAPTSDEAWVGIAARLLKRPAQSRTVAIAGKG